MKRPVSPPVPVPARRRFATTRWSVVLAAGRDAAPQRRKAFAELFQLYWYPLYDFVRRQSCQEDKAEEIIQGFFARMLEKEDLAVADPSRGRFRQWLKASVKHYLANEWKRDKAEKRWGGLIRIDVEEAERCFQQNPASDLTPEQVFDRRWAEGLLQKVLTKLGEECKRSSEKACRFDKLKSTLMGEKGASYARIAEELGMTEDAVKTAVFRLRERYRELLHEEISHSVEKPEDVADELRFLISVFGAA